MKKVFLWTGWVLSSLVSAFMVMGFVMAMMSPPEMVKSFTNDFGYPKSAIIPLGIVEGIMAVLYLIPRTSILGAILLTGFLGGAVATHVRVEQVFIAPVIFGVVVWLGVYLRDSRVRALIPIRSTDKE